MSRDCVVCIEEDGCLRYDKQFSGSYEQCKEYIRNANALPTPWDYGIYDTLRERMVSYIL